MFAVGAVLALGMVMPSFGYAQPSSSAKHFSLLFKQNAIPADFQSQLNKVGATLVDSIPEIGFAEVQADSSALTKLQSLANVDLVSPSIEWSLPDSHMAPFADAAATGPADTSSSAVNLNADLYKSYQWDIKNVTHDGASYNLGTGSHNTVVGIIDTGIDPNHPAIKANLLPGSMNFVPAGGFQGSEPAETGAASAVTDVHGHGTHVAGTIAGNGRILGVAPNMGIRAYRVFGSSSAETSWIAKAIIQATNDHVNVISMSLGGYDVIGQAFFVDPITGKKTSLGNDIADLRAFKRALQYATDHGVLPVVAAGNEAIDAGNKAQVNGYLNAEYGGDGLYFVGAGFEAPGSVSGVVTVSATGPDHSLSSYSNWGSGFVDIAAPGGDFLRYPDGDWFTDMCLSSYKNGGYSWMAGTSMATPKVSAVAALLLDKYGPMSPQKLKGLLLKQGVNSVTGTDRKFFGNGHVDALNALK
ncbi:peptidase S8 [Cohnella pontilimi]|uniref:Peptidase S8 n=2 Tax=Cohnella pontilimi TaxID=2564100 RepID=A0A4U0FD06_9BACL|nr:peptidase S8 [Cohnella pontilimi]